MTEQRPDLIDFVMVGKLRSDFGKPKKLDVADQEKRQDRETGRRLALQYAEEALLTLVNVMRTDPDNKVKMQAAKQIMDRAWGQTKAMTEEEKKGADAGSILDVLVAASRSNSALEHAQKGHVTIEQKADSVTGAEDLEGFFEAVEEERKSNG